MFKNYEDLNSKVIRDFTKNRNCALMRINKLCFFRMIKYFLILKTVGIPGRHAFDLQSKPYTENVSVARRKYTKTLALPEIKELNDRMRYLIFNCRIKYNKI